MCGRDDRGVMEIELRIGETERERSRESTEKTERERARQSTGLTER